MKIGGPFFDSSRKRSPKKWYLSYFAPKLDDQGAPLLANGRILLERKRPYYKTQDSAQADKPRILAQYGAAGGSTEGGGILSREQASEFEQAKALVPELSLVDVARFYRIHHPLGGVARVRELIPLMLAWMETRLGKTRHYEDIDSRLGIFSKKFGDRLPQTLTREELLNYLLNIDSKGRTILNHKRALVNFLNWMTEQRPQIIPVNPLAGVKKRQLPKLDTKEIEFLSIDATRRYLRACERYDRDLVAHEVIQLFSGVRADDEMADFDGQWVKANTREITIPAEIAKMDRREVIQGLEDNFWDWWAAYGRTGLLRPKNHGPRWLRLRVLAEVGEQSRADQLAALPLKTLLARDDAKALLKQWPWNARRRTFCTYHVAKWQSADRTALILRHHGEAGTLHNSYRGLGITQPEGVEFFELKPCASPVLIEPARLAKGIIRQQAERKALPA
jgi:integrase